MHVISITTTTATTAAVAIVDVALPVIDCLCVVVDCSCVVVDDCTSSGHVSWGEPSATVQILSTVSGRKLTAMVSVEVVHSCIAVSSCDALACGVL